MPTNTLVVVVIVQTIIDRGHNEELLIADTVYDNIISFKSRLYVFSYHV